MTLTQVWGTLLIFILCPILGALPLIDWITRALTGQNLGRVGTGNIGVSAAFYHGGRVAGILAVISEASKGILAVLLARQFFPQNPEWELISLIALVMGRYWRGRGAGTTNVVWGFIVHDPIASGLIFLIGGISFTLVRERQQGRTLVLVLLPLITAARDSQQVERIAAAIALGVILYWIYQKMPDDLDLPATNSHEQSEKMFRFFRGDRALVSLDKPLDAAKVGAKAATLATLKQSGYPVPLGWVLPPGDDPAPLIAHLQPSEDSPLIVRSSAIGEDSETASAAGQYLSVANVTSRPSLSEAITQCLTSYDRPNAAQYRQDSSPRGRSGNSRQGRRDAMAVLIQPQIPGVFSGVAFSRDPMTGQGDFVAIEALPGDCSRVVSGQVTPERYQVFISAADVDVSATWKLPEDQQLPLEGTGDVPRRLLQQVAYLVRHLENHYHGIPQDIEWTYDGESLWLLQARPITTLLPIWTRKIAAEVIPGTIRPLTWSLNRPLTCGVWGKLFSLVLGKRARHLDFLQTATLHFSHAYFNASLLGEIFRRMGLPPESLEFLTRGAPFSKPPLTSTLISLPGLLRLLRREIRLGFNFDDLEQGRLVPALAAFESQEALSISDDTGPGSGGSSLSPQSLLQRIDEILELLETLTYYNILSPLSFALRKGMLKVGDRELDYGKTPEISAIQALQEIANAALLVLPDLDEISLPGDKTGDCSQLFAVLAEMPEGQTIFDQFDEFLNRYGYLSDVATDIAVPTWKEDPRPVRQLFTQQLFQPVPLANKPKSPGIKAQIVQSRLDLKGRVAVIYNKLLAHLRWSFLALEQQFIETEIIEQKGDIFFLEFGEIRQLIDGSNLELRHRLRELIAHRQDAFAQDKKLKSVPAVVYGNTPALPSTVTRPVVDMSQGLRGIGASAGVVEGRVKVLRNLQEVSPIDKETILVVSYTDAGWSAVLARAGGLISEVGGQLSHGAIVAREYGIPAVMDVTDATSRLQDGQWVRIDGAQGTVMIVEDGSTRG
ncbi:glycerol-3-phosphate acyltransferase [Laspinema sp. A4]|uniref:glycerol-3-phosphate acyltransferase n=1 Tax=Laspinema sp. D2d TaxID=2953686 RepID=UPI0021BAA263|nr:glycerol-3-phosphate acyltransferase [Laspinema sp. D2d]MCT7985345.1 glycerol-3-phosphate acyltransferase [Laspinema sp. D2d]